MSDKRREYDRDNILHFQLVNLGLPMHAVVNVADYITQRENQLISNIEKPLKAVTLDKIGSMYYKAYVEEGNVFCVAIDEALRIIAERRTV